MTAGLSNSASSEPGRLRPTRVTVWGRAMAVVDAIGRRPVLLSLLVAIGAAAFLWLAIDPLARPSNDPDSTASVMYFDRILNGRHLEAFWPTTPKPLLTLLYGVAWWLTHDWRTLTILTIAAAGLSVGMAARIAGRFGGAGAAVLIVVGLLAWPGFRIEVAGANSFIWGLALWLLFGVLITADRPRPWLAGAALALAWLARTETIWLVGAAAGVVAFVLVRDWIAERGRPRADNGTGPHTTRTGRRSALTDRWSDLRLTLPLLLGGLGLPLACLHDWLLTGRPLYWLSVPAGYTVEAIPGLGSVSPFRYLRAEGGHYLPLLPLLVLGAVGIAWLVRSGRRSVAFALAALTGGVLVTLVVLAWRAIYIDDRYYEEADAPILLAAAIGGGVLLSLVVRRVAEWSAGRRDSAGAQTNASDSAPPRRTAAWHRPAEAALMAVLAIGVGLAAVPQGGATASLDTSTQLDAALRTVDAQLPSIVRGATGSTMTEAGIGYPVVDPAASRILIPGRLTPRLSIELGVPTTAFGFSRFTFRDADYSAVLHPGQWILHIAAVDGRGGIFAPFETGAPVTMRGSGGSTVRLVPVVSDPTKGVWLLRIEAA